MIALLLAAMAAQPVYLPPQVSVPFPGRAPALVMGPGMPGQEAGSRWSHKQTLYSPEKSVAAVRFCQEHGQDDQCEVWLVQPDQPHRRLADSNVLQLLWTRNGRFLIGAGRNTLRLWNLAGAGRTAVPRPTAPRSHVLVRSTLSRLWLDGRDLCVASADGLYDARPQGNSRRVTTRYALPTLEPPTVTTLVAAGDKEAPCR